MPHELRLLVLATRNRHKAEELRAIAGELPVELLTLADFPGFPEIAEDAPTPEGNALKKARAAAALTGEWSAADDTALEVDALGGRPGVHAARYAGPACDYAANNSKLLSELSGVKAESRTARFVTIAALVIPGKGSFTFRGEASGRIAESPRGDSGFGYDPLFVESSTGLTFAEMDSATKNRISHRAGAFGKLFDKLRAIIAMS